MNSHPHRSDPNNEFTIVHNGIITNFKEIKTLLEKKGITFETETDTECVAKLTKYIYDTQKDSNMTFTSLVKAVVKEVVCNLHCLLTVCVCDILFMITGRKFRIHLQEHTFP